ncbi:MAG TPA: LacI family transcriptional regulator [Micrococcales bacterium]|uniref:LacI family DNA-binding transcriptional regulator n=1 Tax=Miniimonas arenae TaxID=676201 RepID=UPI000ED156BE|nr:LacI family DNA-binding transcriptional regulator [Miniimonas arenae]HCX84680.1 LacI family transcriptional regulator [Micrococcales bacterium]
MDPVRRPATTIYDVAALAGVSASTVSRSLNDSGRISRATVEKVRAAAAELGYQLNPTARALLTGRTMTLGLVVADITNPVVFGVIRGAERAAAQHGYTLVIADAKQSGEAELDTVRGLVRGVDGVVLAMSWLPDDVLQALAGEVPLALVNRDVPGLPCAFPDVRPGVDQLVQRLAAGGHERVVFVAGPELSWIGGVRHAAIVEAADSAELSVEVTAAVEPTPEGGRAAWSEVRERGATAVIAYNDLQAIGLMLAAQADGVAVPADLAVAGFDDIYGATFTTPALTSVRSPLEQVAAEAVRQLVGAPAADGVDLTSRLVVRGSV